MLVHKLIRGASPRRRKNSGSNDFAAQNHYLSASFGKMAGGRSLRLRAVAMILRCKIITFLLSDKRHEHVYPCVAVGRSDCCVPSLLTCLDDKAGKDGNR